MLLNAIQIGFLSTSSILGIFIVFGLILDKIQTLNYLFINNSFGQFIFYTTGFVGTSVHEISHAIMAILFGHKVTEIKLFRPLSSQTDGVLGYVNHSYNPNSMYQQVGNFFIGIAPMLIGSLVIFISFKVLLPDSYDAFKLKFAESLNDTSIKSISDIFFVCIQNFFYLLKSIFTCSGTSKIRWFLFLYIMYSICTNMQLSLADLKGSLVGMIAFFFIMTAIGFILNIFNIKFDIFIPILLRYNVFMCLILSIGLFFLLLTLCLSFCLYKIKLLF